MEKPREQDHGERTRILFAYQRSDARTRNLYHAIEDENRYDVTRCALHRAKAAFADHDILITDRGTLITDPKSKEKWIYRGDELIRHLKEDGRNPGLAVIVLSDIQDPTIEYEGIPPLKDPDRYYREKIAGNVSEYFRYPFHLELFLMRLRGYDINRY